MIKFGIASTQIDQRLIADAGEDQTAIGYDSLDPSVAHHRLQRPGASRARRINEFDPYSRYIAINAKQVPNVKIRQAMASRSTARRFAPTPVAPSPVTWPTASSSRTCRHRLRADRACGPTCSAQGDPGRRRPGPREAADRRVRRADAGITYQYRESTRQHKVNAGVVKSSLRRPASRSSWIPAERRLLHDRLRRPEGSRADERSGGAPTGRTPRRSSPGCSSRRWLWNLSRPATRSYNADFKRADRTLTALAGHAVAGAEQVAMQKMWAIPTRSRTTSASPVPTCTPRRPRWQESTSGRRRFLALRRTCTSSSDCAATD